MCIRDRALGDDGALEDDVVAVLCVLAGDDFVGQGVDAREVAALVGLSLIHI